MTTCSAAGKLGATKRWLGTTQKQRSAHSRKMHAAKKRKRTPSATKALAQKARGK